MFGPLFMLNRQNHPVVMIFVEKTNSPEFPFVLRVGFHQEYPMTMNDLRELHFSLSVCRDEGPDEPAKTEFLVLAPWYSPEEELARDVKRDRASLWVEGSKWRIDNREEEDLKQNVEDLLDAQFDAVKAGNIEAVKLAIAKGADVNKKYSFGRTPLYYSALEGYKEVAELLIAKGADVNAKDVYAETPLHSAVAKGLREMAELLIAKGANVNGNGGTTPLHKAAGAGHKEIVELLIANDADVNAKDVGGETPLDWAIEKNYTEIADLLRKHGGKTGEELKAEGK